MKKGRVRAAIAMQIEIAEAVLEEMSKACAIPIKASSSGFESSLGFISRPSSPSASAKEDKAAKGWMNLLILSVGSERGELGSGGWGLKMSESFPGRWVTCLKT